MYIFNSSSLDRDLVIECGVLFSFFSFLLFFPFLRISTLCSDDGEGEEKKEEKKGKVRHVCVRNLVDSASSHMLVSKIKPCKCKFTTLSENGMCTGKLRTAHYNRIRLT